MLHLAKYVFGKEFIHVFRRDGEELAVHGDTDALLAIAQAEGAAELDLIFEFVFRNQLLQRAHNLARALDMAGGTDANGNLHNSTHSLVMRIGWEWD